MCFFASAALRGIVRSVGEATTNARQ